MKFNLPKRSLITAIAMIGAVGFQATSYATTTSTLNISTGTEQSPAGRRVATNGAGLFLHIYVESSTLYGQYVQNGSAVNGRFVIANNVSADNTISVAMNSGGSSVATWWDGTNAVAQLIPPNASGLILSPIAVGAGDGYVGSGGKSSLQVAMDANGDFVVVRSNGSTAFANTFDHDGNIISGDVAVSGNCSSRIPLTDDNDTFYEPYGCRVSAGINNNQFVVAFSQNESSTRSRIYARRYSLTGTPQSNQIPVDRTPSNTYSSAKQTLYSAIDPQIAMDSSGNFVVAWVQPKDNVTIRKIKHCYTDYGTKHCDYDYQVSGLSLGNIFVQRFNAANAPTSKDSSGFLQDFKVVSDNTLNKIPDISMNDQGSFVVAWESDAPKKQRICATDSGHTYCKDFLLPVGSAKIVKFTADDLKIKSNSRKTIETGNLKKLSNLAFLWNPFASTPAVAIDNTGAFDVEWDSARLYITPDNVDDPDIINTVKAKFFSK